jgi:hypothetical protein
MKQISWNTEAIVITPGGGYREFNVTLRYRTDDPYAVCLVFNYEDDTSTEWYLDRQDMLNGLYQPVQRGGDVSFEPVQDAEAKPHLMIHMSSEYGCARVTIPANEMAGFIKDTIEEIRFGKELAYIDFKGLVAYLLD